MLEETSVFYNAQRLSLSPEHYTPAYIVEIIRKVLGSIDFDPASNRIANQVVQATKYYSLVDNGENALELEWPNPTKMLVNSPGERSGQLVKDFWIKTVNEVNIGSQAAWVGFSFGQLATLQKCGVNSPLHYPTFILKDRIPFDTLARVGSQISLWAEAEEIAKTLNLSKKERLEFMKQKVNEFMKLDLYRISGTQPTQNNFITFMGIDQNQLKIAQDLFRKMGVVVSNIK